MNNGGAIDLGTTNKKKFWPIWLSVLGPGLIVMLADTDAGSLITSAQMGAEFRYKLLLQTFVLIPILYMAQELTIRLGAATKKGHGELIKETFGKFFAWISVTTLIITCIGAMVTELVGLNSIGHLYGVSSKIVMLMSISFLIVIAWTGSYRSVEKIALFLGLFEVAFFYVAYRSHPQLGNIAKDIVTFPDNLHGYLFLTAANIGAVIMPWMIFYQQSAVIDKGLTQQHIKYARWDTAIGAILTQCVMAAILIAVAATIGHLRPNTALNTVDQISNALVPFLGVTAGRLVYSIGMLGACLVASIVVTCTAAWGLGEVLGYKRSLSDQPGKAPMFYLVYALILIISGILVASNVFNLITLSVTVEVMNALLLPIVLGFLYLLAVKALPEQYKLKGFYKYLCLTVLGGSAIFGVICGAMGG